MLEAEGRRDRPIKFQFLFTDFPNERPWLFSHLVSLSLSLALSLPPLSSFKELQYLNAMTISCFTKPPPMPQHDQKPLVFDASVLQHEPNIPQQFIWPDHEKPSSAAPELSVPLVDLGGFLSGDPAAAAEASRMVGEACLKHGFFLVVNHGVNARLISDAHCYMDSFFELPLCEKQRAQRKMGEHCGYASSFTGRFSSKLPWKETLSFRFSAEEDSSNIVQDYFKNTMGEGFNRFGYEKNCYFILTNAAYSEKVL